MSGQSRRTRSQLPLQDTLDFDPNTSPFKKARNLAKQNASPLTIHAEQPGPQAGVGADEDELMLSTKRVMPTKRSSSPFDQDEGDLGSSTGSSRRVKKAKTDAITGSFSSSFFSLVLLFSDQVCRGTTRMGSRPVDNPI